MKSTLELVLAERERRRALSVADEQLISRIKPVLAAAFTFTRDRRDRLRITSLYAAVAGRLRLHPHNGRLMSLTRRAAEELGAVVIHPGHRQTATGVVRVHGR